MRKYIAILLTVTIIPIMILVSPACESDYYVPEEIEIPDTVRFSLHIVPILSASCNMSGCHSAGGYSPDLTEKNAYTYLSAYGLIDTDDPESSILYERLISINKPMPPQGNLPVNQIELILKWIRQGALDN